MGRNNKHKTLQKALISTVPVITGYVVMGMAFGILLQDKGYSFLWALLMSTTIYAGSMQFAAVDILSGGASIISTALLTLLINARHVLYGISMLKKYRKIGKAKPYLIFSLTDETYALLCSSLPEGVNEKRYYLYVSVIDQLSWITGCVLGALIGSALSFNTDGLDFAMTALFVVIFTQQWLSTKDKFPALLGFCVTIVCLLLFGTSNFLVASMIGIVLALSLKEIITARRHSDE